MNRAKWKTVCASVIGTSHINGGIPCQDVCRAAEFDGNDGAWLVLAVADGAGSASQAHVGAECVVDTFFRIAEREFLKEAVDAASINREIVKNWMQEIRACVEQRALELDVPLRELASTCLGAVVGESSALFVQLGDGAMVTSGQDGYRAVFWPQSGEFANTTNFLSDSHFDEKFEWCLFHERIDELALFSDGLERLILRFAERAVHGAFLDPFFVVLRQAENSEAYMEPLQAFLNSPRINQRTDDDKTLVLATRINEHRHDDTVC